MAMKVASPPRAISLGQLHADQQKAHLALAPHRFKALRCGRRYGKTEFAKTWIAQGLLQRQCCAWFSPQHMTSAEAYVELERMLAPSVVTSSRTDSVIRLRAGGRVDFWSLENPNAGRSRGYDRVVIDEAAFAKNGDVRTEGSMMAIWERSIKPTLFDRSGQALVCSNSAGKSFDNFFYNICTDPQYGFHEYHATTHDNPLLPKRNAGESKHDWLERREYELASLVRDNDPLVFAQEYRAEFVDWAGVTFFVRDKLLDQGNPVPYPTNCDVVYAVIDTASKTGTEHDATAVTYYAYDQHAKGPRLVILDWDIDQIEGAVLEAWLPSVFTRLEELSRLCRARGGSIGAYIEDKNSGTILLQQARRRGMQAEAIKSKLTAMGKDERAISVSGYVHRELIKYSEHAFLKTRKYKRTSRNHLLDQVEGFRIGDKDSDREDDLLDTFCYGIAIALGDRDGF